jgi:hypothetical protein
MFIMFIMLIMFFWGVESFVAVLMPEDKNAFNSIIGNMLGAELIVTCVGVVIRESMIVADSLAAHLQFYPFHGSILGIWGQWSSLIRTWFIGP